MSAMHEGHRERVRDKYKANGLDGFSPHEVLELLLFYTNKRSDTNDAAHALIERFGSLTAVLEASYDELLTVEGVGDAAATLITLIPNLFRRYETEKASAVRDVTDAESAAAFLRSRFFGLKTERAGALFLDSVGRPLNFVILSEGSLDFAGLDLRKAVRLALQNNAASVVIAHNHPGGAAAPSKADIEATKSLAAAFEPLGITLSDHIVFSDNDYFSMAASPALKGVFGR